MDLAQATQLATTLKYGPIHVDIREQSEENGGGHRLYFTGGKVGEHSIDVGVSDEARVRAHWEGYLSGQPDARPSTCHCKKCTPRPPLRYAVVVEGTYWYHDGYSGSMQECVGWTEVDAVSPCEVRGLVRKTEATIEWEQEGNIRLLRTREFEVKEG